VRLGQADYIRSHIARSWQNNLRFSTELVFAIDCFYIPLQALQYLRWSRIKTLMFFKVIVGSLVGLALLAPVIERFDFWDPPIVTGQDTELTVICLLAAFGALLVLARVAMAILHLALHSTRFVQVALQFFSLLIDCFALPPQPLPGSPPPLRI